MDLMFATPLAAAYKAQPLTVAEIDAHPNRDRIWATIIALRFAAEDIASDEYWRGHADGYQKGSAYG